MEDKFSNWVFGFVVGILFTILIIGLALSDQPSYAQVCAYAEAKEWNIPACKGE